MPGKSSMRGARSMSHGPGRTSMRGTRALGTAAPGRTTMKGSQANFGGGKNASIGYAKGGAKKAPGNLGY